MNPAADHTPRPTSLGAKTTRGFAWLVGQTVVGLGARFIGEIYLAWLLLEDDFGIYAKALTVAAVGFLVCEGGLSQILIHRHKKFDRWSNPAFWLGNTMGLTTMIGLLLAAPLAAWAYGSPQVTGLLAVLALAAPAKSLGAVPHAKLTSQMRFRANAVIATSGLILQTVLAIVFALLGFGVYSLAIPHALVALFQAVAYFKVAKPRVAWNPQWRRWRYLLRDTGYIMSGKLPQIVMLQGDYAVIGLVHRGNDTLLGVYFLTYRLSSQSYAILTRNMFGVLFAALSRMQDDPARQVRKFLLANRVLAIIAAPVCLMQTALADPAIHAVLHPRWWDAVPVMQVLGVGMVFRTIGEPAGSLLQAQGRFRYIFASNSIYAVIFLTMVLVGALLGGAVSVAAAVSCYYALIGIVHPLLAIRPQGGTLGDVLALYTRPLVAAIPATALAMLAGLYVPDDAPARQWLRIALSTVVALAVYLPLIRLVAPHETRELIQRFNELVRRRRKH